MRKPLLSAAAVLLLSSFSFAQSISLTAGSTYSQNFNALANSGTTNDQTTLPAGWAMLETGTNANTNYAGGNGSGNGGDTYSFGTTASTERALGGLFSNSLTPLLGASFTNNTGITLTSITINYTGELWRLGTALRNDQLDFSYSTNATSLSTGTWTDANSLDFVTPDNTGTAGARDGNAIGFRTAISFSITGLSIPNGATFWIRWSDFNASGADDGLAIDDFSLSTNASILPVTLTAFTVAQDNQTVVANWSTASESNSKHFELQRSSNGSSNWSVVTTVAASGNSNVLRTYKAIDASPIAGQSFYRIRSVDLDGSFTYSAIQQVQVNGAAAAVRIYPNPARHTLFVDFGGQQIFKGIVKISNTNGQVLMSQQMSSINGQLQVPLQGLKAGVYNIQLQPATAVAKPVTSTFIVQ